MLSVGTNGSFARGETMKKIITILLLIITVGACHGMPSQAQPEISVKSSCLQSEAVFVSVKNTDGNLSGSVLFLGNEYAAFNDGGFLRVIAPIFVRAKTGLAQIKIVLKNNNNAAGTEPYPPLQIIRSIIVKKKTFHAQYLTLPAKQKQNYHSKTKDDIDEVLDAKIMTNTPKKLWSGNFISPCKGEIVTALGTQRYHNGEYYNFHKGTDIAAPAGAPVYASGAGKVVFVKDIPIVYGKTIVIDHGWGITSLYLHLSKIEAKENQIIKKGQIIGRVGATGTAASGPHLHWSIFAFGEAVNPQCFYNLPEEFR